MTINKMINELAKTWSMEAASLSEFYGHDKYKGIWIKNAYVANVSAETTLNPDHPFSEFVAARGFFAEPYDSETIMLYKA
jgi:hypothetical protein